MKIKYVSDSKIDKIREGPFTLFEDESQVAKRWDSLRESVCNYLSKFSHEEDAEDADGSPGFLLQDVHDNTETMGLEFNDASLISLQVLTGLSEVLNQMEPDFQMYISIVIGDGDKDDAGMYDILLTNKIIYIPKLKVLKARLV